MKRRELEKLRLILLELTSREMERKPRSMEVEFFLLDFVCMCLCMCLSSCLSLFVISCLLFRRLINVKEEEEEVIDEEEVEEEEEQE